MKETKALFAGEMSGHIFFADEYFEMKKQALEINKWAKNVYVKVPVVNSKGMFMGRIIKELND